MVATIASISSSAQAASYYEGDDYYSEDGKAPSVWFGGAAQQQGLKGAVEKQAFVSALEGRLASGAQLGTMRDGQFEHRPGWDMTFSAPKSVSIMAEVAGDKRLIEAHDKAVLAAMTYVEENGTSTRIRNGGKIETVETSSLAAAIFRHDTSRELDPQLHSHAVIMNMTFDKNGDARSLESRELYRLYMKAGAIYRQHLAAEANKLGYGIEQGKGSLFELKGISKEVREAFSGRASRVEEELAARGKTRETATAREKAVIALDTRETKKNVDRNQLASMWRERAAALGFDKAQQNALKENAARQASGISSLLRDGTREAIASAAVEAAARSLSERQAVISKAQLIEKAGEFALGKVAPADVQRAIVSAQQRGDLEARRYKDNRGVDSKGFTTRESIHLERKILAIESRGREQGSTPFSRIDASRHVARAIFAARDIGFTWTADQREATKGLLSTRNRVVGIQGLAGTAKTTTVLATYADAVLQQGHVVRSFAPTANAAALLADALGGHKAGQPEAITVARMLQGGEKIVQEARRGPSETWIVDEASMVSTKDMARLLELSERANARLVLVGDVKQLGSVEAGRAFGQLQDAGMQVWKLENIVRQTNLKTKEAVYAAIAGDGRRALKALDEGGGKVVERADASERIKQIADDFVALQPMDREKTLVLDPSRNGRDKLTDAIRDKLISQGELGREGLRVNILEARNMTREEARHARSYEVGDAVSFRRDYDRQGIEKGEAYTVKSVDAEANSITLVDRTGREIDWTLSKWGRGQVESFAQVEKEFRANDKLQFTRNDREAGRINGQIVHVVNVDVEQRTMLLRDEKGQESSIRADSSSDRHLRHGWVRTIHSAQGATAQRVMAHLESHRANTVDAKSVYVALSRAKVKAIVYTENKESLSQAVAGRSGEKQIAMPEKIVSGQSANKVQQSTLAMVR